MTTITLPLRMRNAGFLDGVTEVVKAEIVDVAPHEG